jgi:RNA polymerase sigma-70 factor (ECF subfamily)
MDKESGYIQLVEQAQLGSEECLSSLAELAGERLRVYVYRLTLKDELTQEIVQESMLEMCRILGKLKRADRFWPWLYGIANNKLRRHHRTEHTRRKAVTSQSKHRDMQKDRQEGFENLVSQELKQIISAAMQNLKTRHRAVLIMRCYDGMSYSEIAESMGCSEFSTRMLFLRAKKSLQKQLSRSGFGRGALLTALVLFGKMTVSSEAAAAKISVTAATTKVGLLAGLVGMATSKSAVVTLTTAGVLTVGSIVVTSGPEKTIVEAGQKPVTNSHIVSPLGPALSDSEEHWYYFPEGPDKPAMIRLMSNAGGKQSYCQFLQNDRANYDYHENTVYINNYRMTTSDLSVLRLPTDSPQLSRFLSKVEGQREQIQYVSSEDRGLLVIATRNSGEGSDRSWVTRHCNVLDEDYFQSDWAAGLRTVDNRDTMHKRGWTYFRVAGQVNGENVYGVGRIPFVYATSKRYSPWLELRIGDSLRIVDTGTDACVYDGRGNVAVRYEGVSFFRGLGRPWMGLHTVDTVRRDAAEQLVWFDTELRPGSSTVQVILTCEQVKLIYTIDLETDVIDEITFSAQESIKGQLRFSYLQDIDSVGNEFAGPTRQSRQKRQQKSKGLLWLVQLAEGSLGK